MPSLQYVWVIVSLTGSIALAQTIAVTELRYDGPDKLSFTVSAEGLSVIQHGDRPIALGRVRAVDASRLFHTQAKPIEWAEPVDRSIQVLSPTKARVRHGAANLIATYDYTFSGEDIAIKV